MDVFISYRRGMSDQPHAGRIRDFLRMLGYEVYYDRDEAVNPAGQQYPENLKRALERCRVIIAVIGESWMAQACRLAEEDDWVRKELLHAAPGTRRHFIPIYMGRRVAVLPDLPPDLQFIRTANAHYQWDELEDAEKHILRQKLRQLIPQVPSTTAPGDQPHPELLCDRAHAEDGFLEAVDEAPDRQRPGCWLLFGEEDQGHHAIFARIKEYTLRRDAFRERFSVTPPMVYIDLEECLGRRPGVIHKRVLEALKSLARARDLGYPQLYPRLRDAGIELCVLYSVVRVGSRREARWWLNCFRQIQEELPVREEGDPQIVLAFSIAYPRRTWSPWELLAHTDLTWFFRSRYRHEFREGAAADETGDEIARRLAPLRREHVDNWCHHRDVLEHIEGIDTTLFLEPFEAGREQPMDLVKSTLARVLNGHSRRKPRERGADEH